MSEPVDKVLDVATLQALCTAKPDACTCALKHCHGWESVSEDRWPAASMQLKGSLRETLPEGQMEASFEEFHPEGTRYDSPLAPIAPPFFPYNRCDAFACKKCGCGVLKYTEYGGYYVDHRVRLIDPDLVTTVS